MTVAINDRRSGPYTLIASQTELTVDFPISADTEVDVWYKTDATGTIAKLTLTTDYTVALDGDAPNTAVVTLVNAAAADDKAVIHGNTSPVRSTDFSTGGDYFATTVNDAEDRQYFIMQERERDLDRTAKLNPIQADAFDPDLPEFTAANQILLVNSTADGFTVGTYSTSAVVLSDDTPGAVAAAGSAGSAVTVSRSDHVHAAPAYDDGQAIKDANGNELLEFGETASAVNHLKVTNAATGNGPSSAPAGGDTNIDHNIAAKGTGLIKLNDLVKFTMGNDIASAGALTLGTDGNMFDITGTTTVTSIGTIGIGALVILQFDGALTLTHHATDLILPGGANITTAAGDIAVFYEYASGDWRCISYQVAAVAPGGGGAFEKIAHTDASAASNTDFTGLTAHDYYMLILDAVVMSTTARLQLRFSTDNGSTFDADANDYKTFAHGISRSGTAINNNDAGGGSSGYDIILVPSTSYNSSGAHGIVTMTNFRRASQVKEAQWTLTHDVNAGSGYSAGTSGGGHCNGGASASADVDAIRITSSSGTHTGGITLLGMTHG